MITINLRTSFNFKHILIGWRVTKKSVRPDQFWQPKLVHLANFGPPSENVNSKQSKVANYLASYSPQLHERLMTMTTTIIQFIQLSVYVQLRGYIYAIMYDRLIVPCSVPQPLFRCILRLYACMHAWLLCIVTALNIQLFYIKLQHIASYSAWPHAYLQSRLEPWLARTQVAAINYSYTFEFLAQKISILLRYNFKH